MTPSQKLAAIQNILATVDDAPAPSAPGSIAEALRLAEKFCRPDGSLGVAPQDQEATRARSIALRASSNRNDIIVRAGQIDVDAAVYLNDVGATQGSQLGGGITFSVGFADGLDIAGAIEAVSGAAPIGGNVA